MRKSELLSLTPMIPTGGSLADALNFFREQMEFSVVWEDAKGTRHRPRRHRLHPDREQ
jgi:hypothetical protein